MGPHVMLALDYTGLTILDEGDALHLAVPAAWTLDDVLAELRQGHGCGVRRWQAVQELPDGAVYPTDARLRLWVLVPA